MPRCTSPSGPKNVVSPESISAVVTAKVRTKAGMSSLIGCAVPALISYSTIRMICSITVSTCWSRILRISASVLRAALHADITGSLWA